MKQTGIAAALAAMVSSLLTLGCCLPVGLLAGLGLAGTAVVFSTARPWLLLASGALLGFGFWQAYQGARCGLRPHRGVLVLLSIAAALLVGLILFPQVIGSALADVSAWLEK